MRYRLNFFFRYVLLYPDHLCSRRFKRIIFYDFHIWTLRLQIRLLSVCNSSRLLPNILPEIHVPFPYLSFKSNLSPSDTVFESLSDSFGFREICYIASRTVISPFSLFVWASLPTQLIQLQCLLSCPSEPVFKPNCYNNSACCPVRLSQSSNPTDTTTVFVVLSVWAGLQTQLLQLHRLLSCPPEAVFKPNC